MKIKSIALILALGIGLSACSYEKPIEDNSNSELSQNMDEVAESTVVYASFYPIYNLTKQIAGDKFDVKSFTNLKTESHGWEPSAKDIAELTNSKLMFINGAGMEEWEESLYYSSDIDLVDTSININLIKSDHHHSNYSHGHGYNDHHHDEYNRGHRYNDHHHDEYNNGHRYNDHHHDEYNNGHRYNDHHHDEYNNEHRYNDHDGDEYYNKEYEHGHNEDHHHHGEYDPHTWLSPKNGIKQARLIAEKLSEIDPANKEYYMANFNKIENELNSMIDEYTKKFDKVDNKNFLVNHQAFGYLAHDFNLNQIALTSLGSTEEADAKTLREVIRKAEELDVNTIFYERGGSDKSASTIATEIGAKTVPLNTLEFATDEELASDKTYQDLIRSNLEEIYKSMKR